MYQFAVMKTCYYNEDKDDKSKWDYEVHSKVFIDKNKLAASLLAEEHMFNLIKRFTNTNHPFGELLVNEPSGIHHWGCDEIYLGFERAVFIYKVVELVGN